MELGACCTGLSSGQGALLPCRRDGPALGQKHLLACGGSLRVRKRHVLCVGPTVVGAPPCPAQGRAQVAGGRR